MIHNRNRLSLLLLLSSFSMAAVSGDSTTDEITEGSQPSMESDQAERRSTAELEALRDKIKRIQAEIENNREESEELRVLFEQNEAEVERALQESKELDEKIRQQKVELENLKKKP